MHASARLITPPTPSTITSSDHPIDLYTPHAHNTTTPRTKHVYSRSVLDNDESITIDHTNVTWSINNTILISHTIYPDTHTPDDNVLLDALQCRFACTNADSYADQPWLVIVYTRSLTVYSCDGSIYNVHAPFPIKQCTPLLEGMLLERAVNGNQQTSEVDNGVFDDIDGVDNDNDVAAPTLYSLLHPLEELKPVSTNQRTTGQFDALLQDAADVSMDNDVTDAGVGVDNISLTMNESMYKPMNDVHEQLVYTCTTQPLLLTYSTVQRLHKLYVVRQSQREVTRRLHFLNDDQLVTNTASNNDVLTDLARRRSGMNNTDAIKSYSRTVNEADVLYKQLLQQESDDRFNKGSITPELILECVYTQTEQCNRYTRVFLAADIEHRPLLCAHDNAGNMLYAYALYSHDAGKLQVQFAYAMPCIAVAPIESLWNVTDAHMDNPYNNDILVVEPNGELALYTGNKRVCAVDIVITDISKHSSQQHKYTDLTDAASNRVTAVEHQQQVRVTVQTGFKSNLVQRCMQAIAMFLPAALLHQFRCDLIHAVHSNTGVDEFVVFNALVHKLIGKQPPATLTDAIKRPSMPCRQPHSSSTNHSAVISNKLQSATPLFAECLPDVLLALHLLYEDMKLNVLHKAQRGQLVHLCASLAQHLQSPQHLELYARDSLIIAQQYAAALKRSAQSNVSIVQPANTYAWLQSCVSGTHNAASTDFPMLHTHESPYDLSRKLRLFYDTLFNQNQQHISYAQTVQQQYAQQQLHQFAKPVSRRTSRYSVGNNQSVILSPTQQTPRPSPKTPFDMQTPVTRLNYNTATVSNLTPSSPFGVFYTPSFLPQRSPLSGTTGLLLSARTPRQSPNLPPRHSPGAGDRTNDELPLFSPLLMKRQQMISASKAAATIKEQNESMRVDNNDSGTQTADHQLLQAMLEEGFTAEQLQSLPYAVAVPLYDVLHRSRSNTTYTLSGAGYSLIGRYDLYRMFGDTEQMSTDVKHAKRLQQQLQTAAGQSLAIDKTDNTHTDKQHLIADTDGTYAVMQASTHRFGSDQRLKEVRHMLSSNRLVCLTISKDKLDEQYLEHSTFDLSVEQQVRLQLLSKRVLALNIGRGMFTIRSMQPDLTKPLSMPPITLRGRIPPKNATIDLDMTLLPPNYIDWPSFHNGVAAGLRISASSNVIGHNNSSQTHIHITRAWILLNREVRSCVNAGLMLGLGLNGHLDVLQPHDCYWYLATGHTQTQIAVLLGQSSSKRGSRDELVKRMLVTHLPALLSHNLQDLPVNTAVQAAAVVSCGFLYQGTADRFMFMRLMEQFDCQSVNDSVVELDCYILSAGIACGLLTLGRGDFLMGLMDLDVTDRLCEYMTGGVSTDHRRQRANANVSTQSRPSNAANVDLTAPAATVAMAFMYMQTNNAAAASRLQVPNTLFMLNYIRPDYIMLRVIAKSVIMWDSVYPTVEWVEAQVPTLISDHVQPLIRSNKRRHGADDKENADSANSGKPHAGNAAIDYQAVRQVYANVLAGACYAMGLRYAGTANTQAAQLISQHIRSLRDIKRTKYKQPTASGSNAHIKTTLTKLDKPTLDICMQTCAIGLAFVMAGTGDLDTFRLLRSLRQRVDMDTTYGAQQCLHMCVGLLFLGGGRLTLSTDAASVAALLVSFYPRWPTGPEDNRYHLQAFRHLYVLAVQARHVQTVDAVTGETCSVSVRVHVRDGSVGAGQSVTLTTPCLLPPVSTIQTLVIDSELYWPIKLDAQTNVQHRKLLQQSATIYVQSRNTQIAAYGAGAALTHSNITNPILHQFSRLMCVGGDDALSRYCRQAVMQCVQHDTPHLLPTFMQLIAVLRNAQHDIRSVDTADLYNIKLLTQYSRSNKALATAIPADVLEALETQITDRLSTSPNTDDLLIKRAVWSGQPPKAAASQLLKHVSSVAKQGSSAGAGVLALIALGQPAMSVADMTQLLHTTTFT